MGIYDTLTMLQGMKAAKPAPSFLKDNYFPTAPQDIYTTDKVAVDFEDDSTEKLAPAVVNGSIPVARTGFTANEYTAPLVAPSRILTVSMLNKRTFGENMFSGLTPEQREAQYLADDIADLSKMITRTEEYMCAGILTKNAYTITQYLNGYAKTGQDFTISFFGAGQTANQAVYTPGTNWNASGATPIDDIAAMAKSLKKKGLPATDLILGADAAEQFLKNEDILKLLDNRRVVLAAELNPTEIAPGATYLGRFNFNGNALDVYSYDAQYTTADGKSEYYIPAGAAIVTAKACGRTAYGAISQYEEGAEDPTTYAASRVPHVIINRHENIKEIVVQARPLAMPKHINNFVSATVVA